MIPSKKLAISLLVGVSVMATSPATLAADVTLRFAHFWPAVAGLHKNVYQKWADAVEEESGGRIKVEMYPSATLSKPPAQYEAVKKGVADVTATVLGYSANRFPLTQVVELPGVTGTGAHGSCVVQTLYDEGVLAEEFTDTKPLFLFTHGPGHFHTKSKAINGPTDFEGLSIRRPTTVVSKILEEMGAKPVGMPAPKSYQSMQRGVIDGVSLPWEGALAFRLNELSENHTEVGLYTLSFIVTMNKQVYDSLPDDLKQVIDNNSGQKWSQIAGVEFDNADVKGRAQAVEAGHNIVTIEGGVENPEWKPYLDRAREAYLAEIEAKGKPARDVHKRALEVAASCK